MTCSADVVCCCSADMRLKDYRDAMAVVQSDGTVLFCDGTVLCRARHGAVDPAGAVPQLVLDRHHPVPVRHPDLPAQVRLVDLRWLQARY